MLRPTRLIIECSASSRRCRWAHRPNNILVIRLSELNIAVIWFWLDTGHDVSSDPVYEQTRNSTLTYTLWQPDGSLARQVYVLLCLHILMIPVAIKEILGRYSWRQWLRRWQNTSPHQLSHSLIRPFFIIYFEKASCLHPGEASSLQHRKQVMKEAAA